MTDFNVLGEPDVWVQCTCGTPYAYRQGLSWSTGKTTWFWSRDCKNTRDGPARMHEPKMWCADGEYVPAGVPS